MEGRANRTVREGKTEPRSQAYNPNGVGQIGLTIDSKKAAHEKMSLGRGYHAPTAGEEIHHCGSQGKHT
jgi:hypothetical protein